MRRITAFILAGLFISACVGQAQVQPLPLVPVASDAYTLADVAPSNLVPIVAKADGNILYVTTPGAVIADAEFVGFRKSLNGRCLVVAAKNVTVFNCRFRAGDDDAISTVGDCSGLLITNCTFVVDDWSKDTKGLLLNNCGRATIRQCDIEATYGVCRMKGGPYTFDGCTFRIPALGAIVAMNARANFLECKWLTRSKPLAAPYWYAASGAAGVVVGGLKDGAVTATNLESKLFFAGCTIDGIPVAGPALCRRADAKTGYATAGSVPKSCFRATAN